MPDNQVWLVKEKGRRHFRQRQRCSECLTVLTLWQRGHFGLEPKTSFLTWALMIFSEGTKKGMFFIGTGFVNG
jgi:hypothetical protein